MRNFIDSCRISVVGRYALCASWSRWIEDSGYPTGVICSRIGGSKQMGGKQVWRLRCRNWMSRKSRRSHCGWNRQLVWLGICYIAKVLRCWISRSTNNRIQMSETGRQRGWRRKIRSGLTWNRHRSMFFWRLLMGVHVGLCWRIGGNGQWDLENGWRGYW